MDDFYRSFSLAENPVRMEFHVSRQARQYYGFEETLFSLTGRVLFADFNAARRFAQQINARRDLARSPGQAAHASDLNAMGLIDEIQHLVIQRYREQRVPDAFRRAVEWLTAHLGGEEVERLLLNFTQDFPPQPVYQGELSAQAYLDGHSRRPDGSRVSNRELALEELILLWLANQNPAYSPYRELFDDRPLAQQTAYAQAFEELSDFFARLPPFGPENQSLLELLQAPMRAAPGSLMAQLEFIRRYWQIFGLGAISGLLTRLLSSLDFMREEHRPVFPPGPPEVAPVPEFAGQEEEIERFSPDLDWMPNLVLIAKNTYVWLDQLSKKYRMPIRHLDQVPDQELDFLQRCGFTGLWLIGVWERSKASQRIKQLRGNPDAIASAYSLFSYDIASDLGGYEALLNLRQRLWQRGIRLAADMVPNHMGIDSRWVIEHPDWFISLDQSPFPSYTFNGPNLSWDDRVGIYIEDHYYDNTDAAVVFKRVDFWTGSEKYIYHGNDGTSMPWNDTAQLNYLLPEVREAVLQTILHVARLFPVIRFDAAMTLTKRHYQRLWYPEPGSGGDIPSRAGLGLTKAEFDRAMPEEFWRMVVDRVAQEAPDTLLLAEAFWLMEGYFVRTLGMHRVYNSAFMHMLRDEKNQEYRLVIKNTLEFDPQILKRYVNFMNNPDERTAVDQFGKGDKYFGVCTMLATMPGLPMFGHGQLEGFAERYGMEYQRALWDEIPDEELLQRHRQQIFPLLRKRRLFAEVDHFLLYDFFNPEGGVNEDVFAYSNRLGEERSLVVYHNRFAEARGWIRLSAAYRQPAEAGQGEGGEERRLVQKTLSEGLALPGGPDWYIIYRDHVSGLEYLQRGQDLAEKGLYLELPAYACRVFLDFRQVQDVSGEYARLKQQLGERGVPSIAEALQELRMQPVLTAFSELANPGFLEWLRQNRRLPATASETEALQMLEEGEQNFQLALEQAETRYQALLETIQRHGQFAPGKAPAELAAQFRRQLAALLQLATWVTALEQESEASAEESELIRFLVTGPYGNHPLVKGDEFTWGVLLGWLFTAQLGQAASEEGAGELSQRWFSEWLLGKRLVDAYQAWGMKPDAAQQATALVGLLIRHQDWDQALRGQAEEAAAVLQGWLQDANLMAFWKVHKYQDVVWFNKEAYQTWLWLCLTRALLRQVAGFASGDERAAPGAMQWWRARRGKLRFARQVIVRLLQAEQASGYQLDRLLAAAQGERGRRPPSRPSVSSQ